MFRKDYFRHREMDREKRHWIAEHVCGYLDGRCAERIAEAIWLNKKGIARYTGFNYYMALAFLCDPRILLKHLSISKNDKQSRD